MPPTKEKRSCKHKLGGLERCLGDILLLQRSWVTFSAPMWWLTTVCNSSPRGAETLPFLASVGNRHSCHPQIFLQTKEPYT